MSKLCLFFGFRFLRDGLYDFVAVLLADPFWQFLPQLPPQLALQRLDHLIARLLDAPLQLAL